MPFLKQSGSENEPEVHLQQVGPNAFKLELGFRYREPGGDNGVPKVPISIPKGLETDLASVPWPLWWLVASYGRHTKAVLLHDSLIDDKMTRNKRRDADRLLFVALKESGFGNREKRKTSWARRWLVWSAVALFGTMKEFAPIRLGLFVLHLFLFIGLLGYLAADHLWPRLDGLFASVSSAWGGLEDLAKWAAGLWPGSGTPEVWHVALGVGVLGILWAFDPAVDTLLGFGLWPWALIGMVVVLPPTILVLLAVLLVAAIDFPSSVWWSLRHGGGLVDAAPIFTPTRTPEDEFTPLVEPESPRK